MLGLQMATQLQRSEQMFQVRRSEANGVVTLALSGRVEEEQLSELQGLLASEAGTKSTAIVLDLADVRLVYREAVKFLATCEAAGIELKNCPSYVREWIEKGRKP
jgi:hypothetical protein